MKKLLLILSASFIILSSNAQQTQDSIKRLDEVIITSTRTNTMLKNTPQIVQVLQYKEIKLMNVSSLSQMLGMMQGVNIEGGTGSGYPKRSIFNMNGLPANYNLVLVNGGRLLSDHIHTGQNLEFIPAEFIEQIEIIRGSASAQYGSDALGGVVNILTRRCKDKPEFSLHTTMGSYNTYSAGITILTPINKNLKVSSYSGWETSDGAKIIAPTSRVGMMAYENYNFMNNIDFNLGKNTSGNVFLNLLKNKMNWKENNVIVDKYGFLFNPGFGIKHQFSKSLNVSANISYNHWEAQQNAEKNQAIQPELLIAYSGIKNNIMLIGGDYRKNYFERTKVVRHDNYIFGVFIQDEYRFSNKVSAMLALRLDKAENINPVFSPKASVLYKPISQLNIRASAGRGFHAPLLFELYEVAFGHGGTAYRFGNPNLKPEYSTNFNLALEVYPVKNLMLMVNGYFSIIDNMIVPVYKGAWAEDTTKDVWMRENINKAYVYGFEASAKYFIFKNYSIEFGYNYSKNKNSETSLQLPYSPGSSVYSKILFNQPIIGNYLSISGFVGFKAVFNRSAWNWKPPTTQVHDYPGGLTTKLKDYQKLDAGITATVLNHYSIFFNAYNILQQDIETLDDAYTVFAGELNYKVGLKIQF